MKFYQNSVFIYSLEWQEIIQLTFLIVYPVFLKFKSVASPLFHVAYSLTQTEAVFSPTYLLNSTGKEKVIYKRGTP